MEKHAVKDLLVSYMLLYSRVSKNAHNGHQTLAV